MKKLFTLAIMAFLVVCSASAVVVKTTLINTDFSDGVALGGWGGTFSVSDGVCEMKHEGAGKQNYAAQCAIGADAAIPEGATVTMRIKAKASEAYTLRCGLQKPDGYAGRGDFPTMDLTTEFQEFTKTTTCTGDGATRVLLNFGDIDGSVYIDNIEVYYEVVEAAGANHALKVSTTEAKSNAWDSQIVITLPTALDKNKNYTLNMKVKGSKDHAGTQGTYGLVALQPVFAEGDNVCYCSNFGLTTQWTAVCTSDGGAITTDGKYAYNKITFNLGYLDGDLYIDDFTITDAEGNVAYSNDFEGTITEFSKPSWHGHVSFAKVALEETVPAEVSTTQVVTMPAAGYRTISLGDKGITLPEGLEAYGAKVNEAKTSVVLTKITSVSSYVAVVLKGNEGNYICVRNAPWANLSAINDLKFDWGEKTITGTDNIYVLAQEGSSVVFAPASAGKLPARKGYLVIEGVSGAKSLGIVFDDEATNIDGVKASTSKNSTAFNLAGQRVNANTKGIVIINGKKFINK